MPLRKLATDDCAGSGTSDLDWGTSFAFSAICCAAAIILYFSPKGCHKVVPSYFLATGVSYAVLGLRQILDSSLSTGLQEALEMTSNIFYGLGSILLLVLSMMMVHITPRSESKIKMVTFWCLIGCITGFMLLSIFLEAEMKSGVPFYASLSFGLLIILMSVYMFHMCWDRTKVWHYIAKALAVFIIAIEVLYSTIIGSIECHQKCSSACRNSSSGTNAIVHDVVLFFGFSILAWGEDTCPSVTSHGLNQRYGLEGVAEEEGTDAVDTSVSDWVSADGHDGSDDIEGSTYGDDQQQTAPDMIREEGKEEENQEVVGEDEETVIEKNHASMKGSSENRHEEGDEDTNGINQVDNDEVLDA